MYKLLFTAFICVAVLVGFTSEYKKDDNYKVIKVNGSILIKKTGKSLEQGDVFKTSTALQFKTPDSKATVINAEKGRFVLTSQTGSKGNNLIPAINNIASRGGAVLNIIDLQNLFSGNFCVLDKMEIEIAAPDYHMDTDHFFYLEYKYKGESIFKQLAHQGDTLIIDKKELYKIDGVAIDSPDNNSVTLFYRDNTKKTAQTISNFQLVFPKNDELKLEVNIILTELKNKPTPQKTEEVMSYLNEFYGKPDKDNVKVWLEKVFGLK